MVLKGTTRALHVQLCSEFTVQLYVTCDIPVKKCYKQVITWSCGWESQPGPPRRFLFIYNKKKAWCSLVCGKKNKTMMLPCLWSQTWKIYLLPPRSLGLESINYFAGAGHSRRRLARLAQSAERKTLNLVVVGSSPTLGETHLNATFHEPLLVQLIRRLFWIFLCLTVPRLMEDCFIPQPRWQTTQDFYFTKADPQNPSVRSGHWSIFLQLQEFSLCNLTVTSSTTAASRSPHNSSLRSATSSLRLQHCGSHWILMGYLYL